MARSLSQSERARRHPTRNDCLPLLAGEGRGEGERNEWYGVDAALAPRYITIPPSTTSTWPVM